MSVQLNEEKLLRSPEEVDSQDEMDQDGENNDENVSEQYFKKFDKVAGKILAQTATILITCDNELGKFMRTHDSKRDTVMRAVQEQFAAVKEVIKAAHSEIRELGRSLIEADVAEVLQQARLKRAISLKRHFDRHKVLKRVEHPRQQVEDMDHSGKAQEAARLDAITEGISLRDLDTIRPEILRDYAERRIRERARSTTIVGHRLEVDSNSVGVKALSDLRKLAIRQDQSVGGFCLALEKLSHKAYPDTPQDVVSLQNAEVLCRQLATWKGSYSPTEALEAGDAAGAYERDKEVALRLERSLRTAKECAEEGRLKSQFRTRLRRYSGVTKGWTSYNRGKRDFPHKEGNMEQKQSADRKTASQGTPNPRKDETKRCYKCGQVGHIARNCNGGPSQAQASSYKPSSNRTANEAQAYSSLVEKWTCSAGEKFNDTQ
ncbi:zinc knuckle [Oesophagostomum dentatum]|uniref:Zinc knuckle n=1 Tax=Oesophagostomum dentatum TaxID=61180 RepID=A0A0B1TML5_OESDE|nr:zinc knuckle [Oesophagostomum dentatum]